MWSTQAARRSFALLFRAAIVFEHTKVEAPRSTTTSCRSARPTLCSCGLPSPTSLLCSFEKVEALRAEIRRKELLERKLAGTEGKAAEDEEAEEEVEEEVIEKVLGQDEAKIDETEDQGEQCLLASFHCELAVA